MLEVGKVEQESLTDDRILDDSAQPVVKVEEKEQKKMENEECKKEKSEEEDDTEKKEMKKEDKKEKKKNKKDKDKDRDKKDKDKQGEEGKKEKDEKKKKKKDENKKKSKKNDVEKIQKKLEKLEAKVERIFAKKEEYLQLLAEAKEKKRIEEDQLAAEKTANKVQELAITGKSSNDKDAPDAELKQVESSGQSKQGKAKQPGESIVTDRPGACISDKKGNPDEKQPDSKVVVDQAQMVQTVSS
ncbi:hypothetical protein R1flu_007353 [Riccia fluitans]|uniref:Uncharacterized protein n=1 Tax=Riccia fluitans TaxID=41844 RepID=A0ABD1Z1A4_9MARC